MNGLLLVDKSTDWTSNDVVAKLRGVLHEKRVGHAGTLDPMATGLLLVLVGRATRASEYAEAENKRYRAALKLGTVTDTQDTTGHVLEVKKPLVSEDLLRETLRGFLGEQEQIPPMYSAIKHKGRPLYEIARRGGEVERRPRRIRVDRLELLGREGDDWLLDIRCSKGTYVRTLCHDIGQRLGCGGCMSSLRRLEIGAFSISGAHTLSQIIEAEDKASLLLPIDSLFRAYPALRVEGEGERRLRCGNELAYSGIEGFKRVYDSDGTFLALALAEQGKLKTVKSFFEVS